MNLDLAEVGTTKKHKRHKSLNQGESRDLDSNLVYDSCASCASLWLKLTLTYVRAVVQVFL